MFQSVSAQANRRQHLLINVRCSIYYHERRRDFFECLCPFLFIVGSVLVSVFLVLEFDNEFLNCIIALIMAVALFLIFITAVRSRLHRKVMLRYVELESRLLAAPNHKQLQDIDDGWKFIKSEAPTVLLVLNAICYNEVIETMGYKSVALKEVSWFQRAVAQVFDYRAGRIVFES